MTSVYIPQEQILQHHWLADNQRRESENCVRRHREQHQKRDSDSSMNSAGGASMNAAGEQENKNLNDENNARNASLHFFPPS